MLTIEIMADNKTSSVILDSFSFESHEIYDDSLEQGESSEETEFFLQPAKYLVWRHNIDKIWRSFSQLSMLFLENSSYISGQK